MYNAYACVIPYYNLARMVSTCRGFGSYSGPRLQRLKETRNNISVIKNSRCRDAARPAGPLSIQTADDEIRSAEKARLRQVISKVNAAALPGPADLASLDATIRRLCRLNPNPDSATSDLINGRWVLLYTASLASLRQAGLAASAPGTSSSADKGGGPGPAVLDAGRGFEQAASPLQQANDVAYRFFYTYVPILAGAAVGARGAASSGLVKARGNFQCFDTRAGKVENQARFEVAGRQCCVNVNGSAEVVQMPPGQPRQRLRAVFTSFDLVVDGQRRLSLPLSLLNPVGFVDTLYLDGELRISVGDKGSLFIASRDTAAGRD